MLGVVEHCDGHPVRWLESKGFAVRIIELVRPAPEQVHQFASLGGRVGVKLMIVSNAHDVGRVELGIFLPESARCVALVDRADPAPLVLDVDLIALAPNVELERCASLADIGSFKKLRKLRDAVDPSVALIPSRVVVSV